MVPPHKENGHGIAQQNKAMALIPLICRTHFSTRYSQTTDYQCFFVDQEELLFTPIDTQDVRVYGLSRIFGYCAILLIVAGCGDKCRYFCRYFSGRCDNRGELVRAEYHTLYTTTICLRGYANKKAPTLCHKWGRVSIKERSVLVGRFVLIRCFFYSALS